METNTLNSEASSDTETQNIAFKTSVQAALTSIPFEKCETAQGLAKIKEPDKELVIWKRTLPFSLARWIEQLDTSHFPDLRILVRPKDFKTAIEPHLDDCGMPPGLMRASLLSDIHDLVGAYADITECDLVDVRLESVRNDACWKYHRDSVSTRLLTTYHGPTTEWVLPRYGEQALRDQRNYTGPAEPLGLHDVAVFKGSCAGSVDGIVHRSPPIAGTGLTRLLLCLNERSAASPKPWPECAQNT